MSPNREGPAGEEMVDFRSARLFRQMSGESGGDKVMGNWNFGFFSTSRKDCPPVFEWYNEGPATIAPFTPFCLAPKNAAYWLEGTQACEVWSRRDRELVGMEGKLGCRKSVRRDEPGKLHDMDSMSGPAHASTMTHARQERQQRIAAYAARSVSLQSSASYGGKCSPHLPQSNHGKKPRARKIESTTKEGTARKSSTPAAVKRASLPGLHTKELVCELYVVCNYRNDSDTATSCGDIGRSTTAGRDESSG
ncbi:hypothetical protein V8F20_006131 [Naviculisporaceae sp. PSN 640]